MNPIRYLNHNIYTIISLLTFFLLHVWKRKASGGMAMRTERGITQAFAIGRSATSAKLKSTVKPTKLVYRVKGQDETKVENPQSKTLRI